MPGATNFEFNVFLSHSTKDKAVVRSLAERLRQDGLAVWFDEWVLKPGDNIPAKIEEGLEHSRVLVLCMSANAFGSDWAQLESGTFRFRDPLNKERRFVPLRLDDAPIKGSLAQFLYINWLEAGDREYAKLFEACRAPAEPMPADAEAVEEQVAKRAIQLDQIKADPTQLLNVWAYAFSPDGKRALSAGQDQTARLWDLKTGRQLRVFTHSGPVGNLVWRNDQRQAITCGWFGPGGGVRLWDMRTGNERRIGDSTHRIRFGLALSTDQNVLVSGTFEGDLLLLDVKTGDCLRVLEGHTEIVNAVAWDADGRRIISGSDDRTLRLWDVKTGCLRVLEGHTGGVNAVAWDADGRLIISGSKDRTLRLWDAETGLCRHILKGHDETVASLACSPDGRFVISGSHDRTVRVWALDTRRCLRVLQGHNSIVRTVAWGGDGRSAFSGDGVGEVRVWDLSQFTVATRASQAIEPSSSLAPEQVRYSNAKVLLVGESGVGKTALSNYLAHGIKVEDEKPLSSTDGVWATHWPLKHRKRKADLEHEIWLWDFAGQVDYRLVHQLFMNETSAAVLVFNPQNENPFDGLGHWDRDLQKAALKPFAKLLVAARIDRGGIVVSAASMKKFMKERGFLGPLHETSAKTGQGCETLREAIVQAIDWKRIPETTSPALYQRMKQEILGLRDSGLVLIRLAELKQRMEMTLSRENFELTELEAVVGLLAGPGMIQRLDFGGFILLQPEMLSRYAAAVVRKVRQHPQELGCIREEQLLAGDLDYQDFERLTRDDEAVLLRTLLETFVSRAWCLCQLTDGSAVLTFPSYFRRERKEQPSHPSVLVTYRFDGSAHDIYAALVVRLHHTVAFQSTDLWSSAADFQTQAGTKLGFTLTREAEGSSLLEVYFEPNVDVNSRVLFLRYVYDHLAQHAQKVVRLRHYFCGNKKCKDFERSFKDREAIDEALAPGGQGKVFCGKCGKPIILHDLIEKKFESPALGEQIRQLETGAQSEIDNESRELILVGHAFAIVAEAGQIYRGYTNSDHGIDGEIEFKDDRGRASGKRLYVQLKSGDSYLKKRQGDGAEVFQIKNPRWADYWQQQAYTVMLVIRTSDGEIRWMDVSAYLKREGAQAKVVRKIIFEGERFDFMSVRRWRDRVLGRQFS